MRSVLVIIIIIVLLALLLFFGGGYMGLKTSIHKGKEINMGDRASLEGTPWGLYYEPIMQGIRWIDSHEVEHITIRSEDGLLLHARLIFNPQAKGTVLMFHGYHTHPEIDFSAAAPIYFGAGNHLLLIDQRASGASQGDYIGFGVLEARDCKLWAEYIAGRFGTDKKITMAGLSMGASTVLMAAGLDLPANVKGIVADSAFSSPQDIIRTTIRTNYHMNSFLAGFLTAGIGFWTKRRAGYRLDEMTIFDTMPGNQIPVLFAHGSADSRVPLAMTEKAAKLCPAEKVVLISPGAEHGTGFLVDHDRYAKTLDAFLRKVNGTQKEDQNERH